MDRSSHFASSSTPFATSLLQLGASSPSTWSPTHLSTLIASLTRDVASRQSFESTLLSTPSLLVNLLTAVKATIQEDADYWAELAQLRAPPRDPEREGAATLASSLIDVDVERRLDVAKKAARMMANGVAGQERAQEAVFDCIDDVRWTLWRLTSFHLAQLKELAPLTRILSQLLSNLITSNPALQQRLFDSLGMTTMEGKSTGGKAKGLEEGPNREAELISRLVSSADAGTRMGAQMMLLNAIAHSPSRAASLSFTPSGALILSAMLENVDDLVERDEADAEREMERLEVDSGIGSLLGERMVDREGERDEVMGMSPVIVQRLFSLGLFGSTFASLGLGPSGDVGSIEDEEDVYESRRLVSPAQVVLLKFLDADLHSAAPSVGREAGSSPSSDSAAGLISLVDIFSHLAKGLIALLSAEERTSSEQEGGGSDGAKGEKQAALEEKVKKEAVVDALVAIVLVLQCLVWCVVRAEQDEGAPLDQERAKQLDDVARRVNLRFRERERGGVEDVVELLRLVSELFPSTSPFGPTVTSSAVPSASDASDADGAPRAAPTHHVLSSTGEALSRPAPSLQAPTLHVKRSLVQLLAALAYLPPRSSPATRNLSKEEYEERRIRARDTQDRVRECKGVTHVLNALKLDERNPYIREHAVFAMRNLLSDNAENQAIVASLRAL